jgi:hypothetical protein
LKTLAHIANASGTAWRVAATLVCSVVSVAAAPPDRADVERQVRTFVNAIAVKPGEESVARWQSQIPLCPLLAGMPSKDGEYILSRIVTAAGAPLGPANCKANFYIVRPT